MQYSSTFNVAEQIFDALNTWDLIGGLNITEVSLKFFQQFDDQVPVGTYNKGSATYNNMTTAIRAWAGNTLISLEGRTPSNLVLPLILDKTNGQPEAPWGALRSEVAVLGAHNAYNGVLPPSWAQGGHYPKV